jgi:hypothetical protein
MRSLWINSDRDIAARLIEEGYAGPAPKTKEGKAKQLASMSRNVWNDREWWKKTWRTRKPATSADASETRGEYVAILDSYKEVGVEILTDGSMRGTPRVQALVALTRLAEAKAKATGVAEAAPAEPESGRASVPFLGIVADFGNLSPAARKKIREWSGAGDDDGE